MTDPDGRGDATAEPAGDFGSLRRCPVPTLEEIVAALRHPSDEVVEAVSAAFARTAAENSELHFEADRTFELAWKGEARAAIAALADAGYVVAPRQYHTRERAIERVADALRAEGFTENGGNPHSWRCEHPDRYPDYCHCVTDLAETAVDALLGREDR